MREPFSLRSYIVSCCDDAVRQYSPLDPVEYNAERWFEVFLEHHPTVVLVQIDRRRHDSRGGRTAQSGHGTHRNDYLKKVMKAHSVTTDTKVFLFEALFTRIHDMSIESSLISLKDRSILE